LIGAQVKQTHLKISCTKETMKDFFKNLFNKNKKEQMHYDPNNIKISDIRPGFVLDYDLKTWEVTEEYEYDWGNENFTYEHKLESSGDTLYLSLEDHNGIKCILMRKIRLNSITEDVETAIIQNEKPPKSIQYQGQTFYREHEQAGYFRVVGTQEWEEFINWDYYTADEVQLISIEQWGDETFAAAYGIVLPESAFSNIYPGGN